MKKIKHWYTNDIEEAIFVEGQEPNGWHRGRLSMSIEQRKKLSMARIDKPAWNKGKPCSEDAKQKISKAKLGKHQTAETKQKRSKALTGIKRSKETRSKMAKAKLGHIVSEETRAKIRKTKAKNKKPSKYKGIARSEAIKQKISQAVKQNYVEHKEEIQQATIAAKRKNKSFGSSKDSEDVLNEFLVNLIGKNNFIRQYRDPIRYPFNCDFYIPSLDLFIELNHYWSHGTHKFDANNAQDIERLAILTEKAKTSHHYEDAIDVWTKRDPLKYKFAEKYKLNYLVSYNQSDLEKIKDYLNKAFASTV